MTFTFFGKPPHMGRHHMQRLSTLIRGIQMAEHLGAKFNPTDGYQDDICIHIKPFPDWLERKGRKNYIDVIDGWTLARFLKGHPEYPLIVCSQTDYMYMTGRFPQSHIVLIPQHHCNFERQRRPVGEVKTVGALGGILEFPPGFREGMAARGLELIECTQFRTRQDVVNFFMSIDVHIVWRPWVKRNPLSNPLKLVNAASFGVPTIALHEPTFREMNRAYMPVSSGENLLYCIDGLRRSPHLVEHYVNVGLEKAEVYHIDNIGRMYEQLL